MYLEDEMAKEIVTEEFEITPEVIEVAIDALRPFVSAQESSSNLARMAEAVLTAVRKMSLYERSS
jgi:hypothetical protein